MPALDLRGIMAHRVLLAEDEESLREMISLNLEIEGYHVVKVADGKTALEKAMTERFDLIILDVMLPEISGFSICESIRLENKSVPVLFLTAKNSSSDRVSGLRIGADDYLSKPFDLEELLLRIQSLIQRGIDRSKVQEESQILIFGKNQVNFNTYEIVTFKGKKTTLSKKEIMLLKLLSERKGEVVSRKTILEKVWGYDIYPSTRTIDNFILAFRKYFEETPRSPKYFQSIRGVGYKFNLVPVSENN